MLLQEDPALDELALKALVQEPGASAKRVWQLLRQQRQAFSLRGVYKELNKLIEQGILVKQGESYHLRLAWIMNLLAFGDLAYERYCASEHLSKVLGGEQKKMREKFSDLRKLDRLWTQLILTLHQLYPGRMICFWCPYQWFHLAHYFTCKQFYQAIDMAGHTRCHIIGNDSFLARRALQDLPKHGHYSFAKSPFDAEQSTYYTVVADRVITVSLDAASTAKLHTLFSSVRKETDINANALDEIFSAKVNATLSVETNAQKAERLRKKFSEFFGMKIV